MTDTRQFVLLEYYGGPRDGQREVMSWPLVTEEIRISLPVRDQFPRGEPIAPPRVESRIGKYQFRGYYRVMIISEEELALSNVSLLRMLAIGLGDDTTVFDWKGED